MFEFPILDGALWMIPGFRVIRELGGGGMATVYLAEQESLGREVALKVLSPAMAADADFAERFLREARISGGFRHRHLISVLDAGRAGDRGSRSLIVCWRSSAAIVMPMPMRC